MRLVFPTLWSPSNTIFVRFGGEDEKSAETGVAGVSMSEAADLVVCDELETAHMMKKGKSRVTQHYSV